MRPNIEEILERVRKATPGPYQMSWCMDDRSDRAILIETKELTLACLSPWVGRHDEKQIEADADLMTHAPTDLAELCAYAGRLEDALRAFVRIDDLDRSGKPLFSNQGQGMDGYTKLANYESCV